jgi:hypothetical protein
MDKQDCCNNPSCRQKIEKLETELQKFLKKEDSLKYEILIFY